MKKNIYPWDQILFHLQGIYFSYYYENNYINEIKKGDIGTAKHFRIFLRFFNNLTPLHDYGEFGRGFL